MVEWHTVGREAWAEDGNQGNCDAIAEGSADGAGAVVWHPVACGTKSGGQKPLQRRDGGDVDIPCAGMLPPVMLKHMSLRPGLAASILAGEV